MDAGLSISTPITGPSITKSHAAKGLYDVHRPDVNITIRIGTGVYDIGGICPPISKQNSNVFNSTFGIKIQPVDAPVSEDDDESYGTFLRPISPFEVASCYRLSRS